MLGQTAAALLGRRAQEALDAESAASWKDRSRRAFEGETLALRDRHGSRTWNISVFPIAADGKTGHVGVLAREVTPWNTAEQELRHTVLGALKAMDFARQSASRFLHDSVGQNLTALGLQLDLMRMDLETGKAKVSVERIRGLESFKLDDLCRRRVPRDWPEHGHGR